MSAPFSMPAGISFSPPPIKELTPPLPFSTRRVVPSKISGKLEEFFAMAPLIFISPENYQKLPQRNYVPGDPVLVQRVDLKCIYAFGKVINSQEKVGYWVQFDEAQHLLQKRVELPSIFVPLHSSGLQLAPCQEDLRSCRERLVQEGAKIFLEEIRSPSGQLIHKRPLFELSSCLSPKLTFPFLIH